MTGIYCIENSINNKKYIGQSLDIEMRWMTHRNDLRRNCHYNNHLQSSWNKYGEESFSFYVLELCDSESLTLREKHYIQKYDTLKSGYNQTDGGEGTHGYTHTDEYKKYMSERLKGVPKSEEAKKRMSLAKKGRPLKNRDTEKVKEGYKKASQKLKGRKHTDEHRMKNSESHKGKIPWNKGMTFEKEQHPMYGKHHSEETKRKISEAHKGKKIPEEVKQKYSKRVRCVETGEIFNSITKASESIGVSIYAISNVLRGKTRTCKNLHWEYWEGGGESNDVILN